MVGESGTGIEGRGSGEGESGLAEERALLIEWRPLYRAWCAVVKRECEFSGRQRVNVLRGHSHRIPYSAHSSEADSSESRAVTCDRERGRVSE